MALNGLSSSLATAVGTQTWKERFVFFLCISDAIRENSSSFALDKKNNLTGMGEKILFSHFRVDQPFQNPKIKVINRLDKRNLG